MKISAIDRCLIDMDVSQNPFLRQLITTSRLEPEDIQGILRLFGSVKGQIQLAAVIKSTLRGVFINAKDYLVEIPMLKFLKMVKPENISTSLTDDEHRAIVLNARDGKGFGFLSGPLFDRPSMLIAKNMILSMVVDDITNMLQTYNNPPPLQDALKKLDEYFDTIPQSPIKTDQTFKDIEIPTNLTPNTEDLDEIIRKSQISPIYSVSSKHSRGSLKRPASVSSVNSKKSRLTSEPESPIYFEDKIGDHEILTFDEELENIFS